MRLHLEYTLVLPRPDVLSLPLSITAEGKSFTVEPPVPPFGPRVVVEGPVNPTTITVVTKTGVFKDNVELPGLQVPEYGLLAEFAHDVSNALTFLRDEHISLAGLMHYDVVIAETAKDERRLAELGTAEVWGGPTSAIAAFRTTEVPSSPLIGALLRNRAGLMIYADVVALHRPAARFRELWRVLESAFGCDGDELVESLVAYAPAVEMGFTLEHVKQLLVLRGRASHAASKPKASREEIARVNYETERRLPSLKSLVERVLLTKRSWGRPTGAVDAIFSRRSFVGPDNSLNLFQPPRRRRTR
jgi:hypothetical protein